MSDSTDGHGWAETTKELRQQLARETAPELLSVEDFVKVGIEGTHKITPEEKDTHKPTVTYWMNMFIIEQKEVKKRRDEWLVLRQQVDDLTAQLATAQARIAELEAEP